MIYFAKYHGCGTDYVILEEESIGLLCRDEVCCQSDLSGLAEAICRRRTGLGADGMIVIRSAVNGRVKASVYNSDGYASLSLANGIWCLAKYCLDYGLCREMHMCIECGGFEVDIEILDTKPFSAVIVIDKAAERFYNRVVQLQPCSLWREQTIPVSGCTIFSPHMIVWEQMLQRLGITFEDAAELARLGEALCGHSELKGKSRVCFARVLPSGMGENSLLTVQTYEPGAGMRRNCADGICAAAVIGKDLGYCSAMAESKVKEGVVCAEAGKQGAYLLRGPAVKVGEGFYCRE